MCGADRIELCADLAQGGTTPSIGMIRAVAASVEQADVQVIGRPRGGTSSSPTQRSNSWPTTSPRSSTWPRRRGRPSASRSARPAGRRNRWATDPRRWLRASGQGARHRRGDGGERGSSTSPGTVGPRRRGLGHGSGGDCHPPDSARKGGPSDRG
ncbi:MAG: hypothetical protein LCH60_04715 [Actinobacteria bacterium]|nr:hypothetical protein [Actinomycetota bacterium]